LASANAQPCGNLRLIHHKRSHFLPSAEAEFAGDKCMAEGLVVAVDCDRSERTRADADGRALLAAAFVHKTDAVSFVLTRVGLKVRMQELLPATHD
jgi:hypothetical protein